MAEEPKKNLGGRPPNEYKRRIQAVLEDAGLVDAAIKGLTTLVAKNDRWAVGYILDQRYGKAPQQRDADEQDALLETVKQLTAILGGALVSNPNPRNEPSSDTGVAEESGPVSDGSRGETELQDGVSETPIGVTGLVDSE